MKPIKTMMCGLCVALSLFTFSTNAALIDFTPEEQDVLLGDSVTIDVMVSDLTDSIAIGAFDLFVQFDTAFLSLTDVVFGDGLDLFGFGSIQDVQNVEDGIVEIAELSWDFAEDLLDMQSNDFTLFSLVFNTISVGETLVGLATDDALTAPAASILSDQDYFNIDFTSTNAKVNITDKSQQPKPVPEPTNLWVLLLGAIFLCRHLTRKYC